MPRLLKARSHKKGMAPGSVIYVGNGVAGDTRIELLSYSADRAEERTIPSAEFAVLEPPPATVTWIDIDSLQDIGLIQEVGARYGIHELVLEDVVNTGQRPKLEEHPNYICLVLKGLDLDSHGELRAEQLSLILGDGWVLSFHERASGLFDGVRDRIGEDAARIRKMGADYLVYALVDAVVDDYYEVLESLGENLDILEDDLLIRSVPEAAQRLHAIRRELIFIRKAIWPLRDMMGNLHRSESPLICEETRRYVDDVHDHLLQVLDTVGTFRDLLAGLQDIYLSSVSNGMNEVMKTLTIIATLFIPLTFIAGIYGMNFEQMPELHWAWGYFSVWGLMAVVAATMLIYFRRKRWL